MRAWQEYYKQTVAPNFYRSSVTSPSWKFRALKITLNMGVGEAVGDKKVWITPSAT